MMSLGRQQSNKKYYQSHAEEAKAKYREWASRNREKVNAYARACYHKHKEQNMERAKAYRCRLRIEVLTHYGNGQLKCVSCNEDRLACLTIDHINNNGAEERRELKTKRGKTFTSTQFYTWLKQNNFPLGYQTLCMNCQWVKKAEYEHI